MFLLDVSPDPVSIGGVGALLLLAIVVLILSAMLIVGFVLLLKFLQRRKADAAGASGASVPQPSSPNQ